MAARFSRAVIEGHREAVAAFKRAPEALRVRLGEATSATAFAVLQRQRAAVRVRSGALKAALDWSYSDQTGVANVGIRKGAALIIAGTGGSALTSKGAKAYRPGKYGHLVEFGHGGPHPAGPHPFAIPAAEAEKGGYLARCRAAGQQAERDLSSGGGLL